MMMMISCCILVSEHGWEQRAQREWNGTRGGNGRCDMMNDLEQSQAGDTAAMQ